MAQILRGVSAYSGAQKLWKIGNAKPSEPSSHRSRRTLVRRQFVSNYYDASSKEIVVKLRQLA
jgi:hypothetical protein